MSKYKQMCSRLILVCVMAVLVPFQSLAATARIAFSDPSGQVGSEVRVTMKFSSTDGAALGNTDVMLAYDATALEYINETENASGGNGAIRVWSAPMGSTEAVTELRFKALKAGETKITVSSWEGYDNDGQYLNVEKEGTSTVKIAALETSSNDARLQSLQVYPGTLEPGFAPVTTSYTTSVGLDVEKLTIDAKAANDKATVTVEGGSDLQAGENTVVCKVTAEDGTTVQTYTITVNKVEGGATGEGAEGGESSEATETTAPEPDVLAELDVLAKKIRIVEVPADVTIPAGLKESSIQIGDAKVTGWINENQAKPEYCVLYGMNENGDQNFYRYDLTDKTVQRYFQDELAAGTEAEGSDQNPEMDFEAKYSRMKLIAMALGGVSAVLLIVVIVLIAGRKRASEEAAFVEPKAERKPEKKAAARGRKLSKEERYMMGEEDEYVEEDPEEYMPETADESDYDDGAYDEADDGAYDDETYDDEAYDDEAYDDEAYGDRAYEDESKAAGHQAEAAQKSAAQAAVNQKPAAQKSAAQAAVNQKTAAQDSAAQAPVKQRLVEDVEQAIARNLAKEAAAATKEEIPAEAEDDEDDFEFFDL